MEEEHNNKLFHALNLYESFISSSTTNKEVIVNYLSDNSSYETRFFNDLTKVTNNNVVKLEINNNNLAKAFNASNTLLELLNITRIYNLLSEYLSLTEMVGFYILVNNSYDNNNITENSNSNNNNNTNNNNTKESIVNQWIQNTSNRRNLDNEILYLKLKILRTNLFCMDIKNSIDYILFIRYSQQLNSINESLALQSFQSSSNLNIINSYMECVAILHQKFLDSILLLNQSVKYSTKEVCEIKLCMINNVLTNLQENIKLVNNNNYNNILETVAINNVYNDSVNFIKLKIENFQSEVMDILSNDNININIETNNVVEKMNDLNNISHDILLKQYDDQISIEHEQFTKQLFDSYDNCMNIIVKHMENNLISEELHY